MSSIDLLTMTAWTANAAARNPSNRVQRGSQIGDEIAGVFDADRYADQCVRNADPIPRQLGHARVSGAGRVRHQGFGAAQAHRELDYLQCVEHAKRLRLAALDRESEGGARALALPLEYRISWIVGCQEPEIIDARDLGVTAQKFRHQVGVLRRLVHA